MKKTRHRKIVEIIEKRYASLRSCIMTHAKFECTRLRN